MSKSWIACCALLWLSCGSEHSAPADAGPGAEDSGSDAQATDSGADAGSCRLAGDHCEDEAQALDATAKTPAGTLHIRAASAYYWNGFTSGLQLHLQGEGPDGAFSLVVRVMNESSDVVLAPGRYLSSADGFPNEMSIEQCSGSTELKSFELTVDEDQVPDGAGQGKSIELCRLKVLDPGWSLDVPFHIVKSCGQLGDV
jgi:hypothetical protein